jgi:hypothetical protein
LLLFLARARRLRVDGSDHLFSIVIVATWRAERPSDIAAFAGITRAGGLLLIAGTLMTIVFGVSLAIEVDRYRVWDGWVIAAIVLWAIAMETGRRAGTAYAAGMKSAEKLQASGQTGPSAELLALNRTASGLLMHALTTIAVVLILLDMIWKPGA